MERVTEREEAEVAPSASIGTLSKVGNEIYQVIIQIIRLTYLVFFLPSPFLSPRRLFPDRLSRLMLMLQSGKITLRRLFSRKTFLKHQSGIGEPKKW